MDNSIIHNITFTGGMDQDSNPAAVEPGDYISCENMSNSALLRNGDLTALPSSGNLAYIFPAGTNKVIGTCEDKQSQSVIVFYHNSLGDHRIVRIYDRLNRIEEVAGGSELLFNLDRRIHSIRVVDGKLLYWTDGQNDRNEFSGGELRKINIEKSSTDPDSKFLKYEIYAGLPGAGQFQAGRTYTARIMNGATVVQTATYTAAGAHLNDPKAGLAWLGGLIQAGFPDITIVEICDCKIKITVTNAQRQFQLLDTDPQVILVPENHYVFPSSAIKYQHTVWPKYTPTCAPVPSYISNPEIEYNNVRNLCAQFRTRYIFDDDEASAWSAISMLPLNSNQPSLNGIRVDFTDPRLSDPLWICLIRGVEIAFRDGNTGPFRLIKRIPACEFGVTTNYIDFFNDKNYTVIPSDDISVDAPDLQIIMNDHNVPRGANTIEMVSDDKGDSRMVIGAPLIGYNCPECIDVNFPVETYEDDDFVDIIGVVNVINDPSFPSDNPNYHDYHDGFVVYLAGTTHYAVSNNPSDGSGDGSFIIRNVPKGRYSIRVAHYMCRYGGDRPEFDLLNGIEWQKTSAPVIDVAGGVAANGVSTERLIDLTGFTGDTFDLMTEVGYGSIDIQNAHADLESTGLLVEIYVYDNFGKLSTVNDRAESISCENQEVRFYPIDFTDGDHDYTGSFVETVSDHNGYAYAWLEIIPPFGFRVFMPNFETALPSNVGPFFAPTNYLYKGVWGQIKDDTAEERYHPVPAFDNLWNFWPVSLSVTQQPYIFYMFCGDPNFAEFRRHVLEGYTKDINGAPVANALVWLMQGRAVRTNSIGQWIMTVFTFEAGNALGPDQDLYTTYEPDSAGAFPPTPDPFDISGELLTDILELDLTFVYPFEGGIIPQGRFVKSGGIYKMGILYMDDFNRSCLIPAGTVNVPFHTEDGQYVQRRIRFEINSRPPQWAKKYSIVRTRDGYYENYAQIPVADALYAVITDGYENISFTSFASGSATHILLQIGVNETNIAPGTQTLVMFQENNPDGYRSKLGDRVRYLLDENQDTVFDDTILDVNVVGEYVDGDKYYVVITYDNIGREIIKDWVFEFYTPKGVDQEIYYETGVCLEIGLPGQIDAYHKGLDQDQSYGPDLPATGEILSGDTYWYMRQFILYGGTGYMLFCENDKVRLLDDAPCEDIGRAFIYDPNARENFVFSRMLISGTYVPNSSVNNLSVFGSLDFINMNRQFGPLRRLVMVHTVLVGICEFKTQTFYIGKDMVVDLSNNGIVGRSTALLNIADETVSDAGTVNPESVCVQDGRAYWWDLRNSTVWRHGPDGTKDIRDKVSTFFRINGNLRKNLSRINDVVVSGFDRKYKQWYLTLRPAPGVSGRTIVLNAETGRWTYFWTPTPEGWAAVGDSLFHFAPQVYRMYGADTYLLFQDIQYDGTVQVVANQNPFVIKDWMNVRAMTRRQIIGDIITIQPSAEYPNGMQSQLPAVHWKRFENQWFCHFLRDRNDPRAEFTSIPNITLRRATAMLRGRYLKGGVALITFKLLEPTLQNFITFVDVETIPSNITR